MNATPPAVTTSGPLHHFAAEARLDVLDRERLWATWTDPAEWGSWDRGLASARLLDPAFTEGATGEITDLSGRRSRFVVTHIASDKSAVAYAVRLPGARLVLTRSVHTESDATRVRHDVQFKGPAGPFFTPVLGRRFRTLIGPSLEAMLNQLTIGPG